MGRELQKRKRRSSRAKVRMPNRPKKALNPLGNGIIAKNWNKKETLSQNYARFGLVAKLGKVTGGTTGAAAAAANPLAVKSADQGLLRVGEVRVERDEKGRITRVLRPSNPLGDPLNELESDDDDDHQQLQQQRLQQLQQQQQQQQQQHDDNEGAEGRRRPEVVQALEREASRPTEKTVRKPSEREVEWLRRLVERHGDDTAAMARDARLNPMQQTAADIGKRLRKAGLLSS